MNASLFAAIDSYIDHLFVPPDEVLDDVLASIERAGLPAIQVSPAQGKLLYLLARATGARRVLEIGTLAGYSTLWLARALPDGGRLVTLEAEPRHAEVARANLSRAGQGERVEVRLGAALETLDALVAEGVEPFDLVFIDADKPNYVAYLERALRLARPGALLLADNVVRGGRVLDPPQGDDAAEGARAFNAALAADPRVEAVVLQQVGSKGHDGMALAVIRDEEGASRT